MDLLVKYCATNDLIRRHSPSRNCKTTGQTIRNMRNSLLPNKRGPAVRLLLVVLHSPSKTGANRRRRQLTKRLHLRILWRMRLRTKAAGLRAVRRRKRRQPKSEFLNLQFRRIHVPIQSLLQPLDLRVLLSKIIHHR